MSTINYIKISALYEKFRIISVSTLKSLIGLQHPYIEPIKYATCNENGVLVIRKFYKHGTLKDQICVASCPKKPYLAKYGNPKERKALPLEDIAKYGIQILEALKFLQSKGLPYGGHLHSGNIVIYEGSVRLLDIENFICGVPSFYRPFFVQHSKLYSLETIDVYCFGHVLYEMFMGHPLQESQARQISSNCPDSFKQLLESILSKEACKVGLPFLDGLLQHQFFKEYFYNRSVSSPTGSGNTYFKLSINVKSDIQAAKLKYEQRLRDEQKSIKNQKRLVKVQEFMSLEEERKSKHRTKTEQRQARLKHQHSLHKNHSFSLNERTHSSLDNSQSISSVTTETPEHNICELVEPRGAQSSFSEAESVKEGEIKKDEQKSESQPERSALLESISSFNRKSLRRVNNTEH
ncbi:PXK family protein [Megaselia abdita]